MLAIVVVAFNCFFLLSDRNITKLHASIRWFVNSVESNIDKTMANTDNHVNDCIQADENTGNEQQLTSVAQPSVKLQNSTIVSKEDSLSTSHSERDGSSQSDAESESKKLISKSLAPSHEIQLQLQPAKFSHDHPNIINEWAKNSTLCRSTQVNQPSIPAKAEVCELIQFPPVGTIIHYSPDDIVAIEPNQIHLIPTISKTGEKAAPIRRTLKSILKRPIQVEENSTPAATTIVKRENKENILAVTPSKVQKLEKPVQVTMTKIESCSNFALPEILIEQCDAELMLLVESIVRSGHK